MHLTQEGELSRSSAASVLLAELKALEADVSARHQTVSGLLRVNALVLGRRHIAPAVAAFSRQHPRVSVQLTLTDRPAESGGQRL